ncbi:type 1 glutamine amidotransferase domain-containing protein [Herbaspirillum sp. C7C2]|uniref:type 1 glutamine amidotransferase domain-containing protein n=1 Tax=Herbaspirillum sp. C7C2 TaxID=2736666 RepID=UPI001F515EDB|nr:type 1 glutamine amidotransferase domain-containing protein [Herbaspirillum sp. C7C2]MCI1012837.1 type 1 glutamine amidotransferase domain-containing protein [Herbaspirillum sp. C7C2]
MSMKTVLFILTNSATIGPNSRATGYFFPEVAHPVEVFEQAGIAVEFASPLGGTPPEDGYDANDPAQLAFRNGLAIRRMARSRKLSEVDVLDYDAIFFPGGLGPMVDIAVDPEVKRAIARAWDAGKIVSAVCHGPAAFLGVTLGDGTPLLRGRKLTSFSNEEEANYAQADVPFQLEDALRAEGAEHTSTAPWQAQVVVDGRLITGQNPASGAGMAAAVVQALTAEAA